MIHEKQIRQLCAIHAVNNLLQIQPDMGFGSKCCSSDSDEENQSNGSCYNDGYDATSKSAQYSTLLKNDDNRTIVHHYWTCLGRTIYEFKCHNIGGSPSRDKLIEKSVQRKFSKTEARNESKRIMQFKAATQSEFDKIAEECTIRERRLLEGKSLSTMSEGCSDESTQQGYESNKTSSQSKLSLIQKISNHYATPYFGNYSLSVLETALRRRGVEMEFFRVPEDANLAISALKLDNSSSNDSITIGFIVYEDNKSNSSSLFGRIGSRIPLIRSMCGLGRHWYAITRVQYHRHITTNFGVKPNDSAKNDGGGSEKVTEIGDGDSFCWYVIDSERNNALTLHSHHDLARFLASVQKGGDLVFLAKWNLYSTENLAESQPN